MYTVWRLLVYCIDFYKIITPKKSLFHAVSIFVGMLTCSVNMHYALPSSGGLAGRKGPTHTAHARVVLPRD